MSTKLNSFILSDDVIRKMKDKLEDTKNKDIETGFSLCTEINKNVLIFGNECEGDECRIRRPFQRCKGSDMYEGFYHTHPDENARPSTADLYGMYLDGLGCIGSRIDNNIKCFVRKSPQRDQKILDALEFEHYWLKFHAEEISNKEYEERLKNLADKYFTEISI